MSSSDRAAKLSPDLPPGLPSHARPGQRSGWADSTPVGRRSRTSVVRQRVVQRYLTRSPVSAAHSDIVRPSSTAARSHSHARSNHPRSRSRSGPPQFSRRLDNREGMSTVQTLMPVAAADGEQPQVGSIGG